MAEATALAHIGAFVGIALLIRRLNRSHDRTSTARPIDTRNTGPHPPPQHRHPH